jgi:hypothetical protein
MKRALWKRIYGLKGTKNDTKGRGEAHADDTAINDNEEDPVTIFKHPRDDISDDDLRSRIQGKTPRQAKHWMRVRFEMVAELRRLKVRLGLNSDKSSPHEDNKSTSVTTSKDTRGKGKGAAITDRSSTKGPEKEVAQALSRLSILDPASHAPPSFDPVEKKIKICLLGDSGAGKTALFK